MNKVLQAAGRVIRTSEDTGVIALLDERFLKARLSGTVSQRMAGLQPCDKGFAAKGPGGILERCNSFGITEKESGRS